MSEDGGLTDLPLKGELLRFLERNEDPVEGALIVARIIEPAADADWARAEIERIAEVAKVRGEPSATHIVAEMADQGFAGARERYYELENSVLPHVLRSLRGIPVSLGVVAMGIARHLGLDALGVNFPRHFLVTIGGELVDPFGLRVTTREECIAWLRSNGVAETGAFAMATPREVTLRMLNNARMLVQRGGDPARALTLSDYQLLIVPEMYGIYVERADLWMALGAPEMVTEELERAVKHAPSEEIAGRLRERARQSRGGRSTVN